MMKRIDTEKVNNIKIKMEFASKGKFLFSLKWSKKTVVTSIY